MNNFITILLLFISISIFGQTSIKRVRTFERSQDFSIKIGADTFYLINEIEYDSIGRKVVDTKVTSMVKHSYFDSLDFVHKGIYLYEQNSDNHTYIFVRRPPHPDSCVTSVIIEKSSSGKTTKETRLTKCLESESSSYKEFEYNKVDSLIEESYYSSGELRSKDIYKYDSKNRLIEIKKGGASVSGNDFYHFRENYSIKLKYRNTGYSVTYSYTEQVRFKTEKRQQISYYNNQNQLIKVVLKRPNRSSQTVKEYNDDGQLTKETSSDLKGRYASSRFYHYNKNGDLVKIYDGDKLVRYYEYDYWNK